MQEHLSLAELAARSGLPPRTVRYYIQLGLVDRPEGETRAARYGTRHLQQLAAIRRWQQAGLPLRRIAALLAQGAEAQPPPAAPLEVWSRMQIADGLELMVQAERAGMSAAQLRRLQREIALLYARLIKEEPDEPAA